MKKEKRMSISKKKSPLKVITRILCGIIALVIILLTGVRLYFRLPVTEYYKNSEKAFVIPGLSDGMTHQGLAYNADRDEFLITGYRSDGAGSQISIVSRSEKTEVKRLTLMTESGEPFTSHVGGISLYKNCVFVADGCGIATFSLDDINAAEDKETVKAVSSFDTETDNDSLGVAFIHVDGDSLFVGEFYREENYKTPDSHKITTAAGDSNTALILEYTLSGDGFDLSENATLKRAYSVTGLVQGMCTDGDGRIYLSTSYGMAFSHIYVYENPKEEGTIEVLGETVPLFSLDSSSLLLTMKLPPMSEEIVAVDGKLYTMCEAATDKYVFGKFTSANYCYATDLSKYVK